MCTARLFEAGKGAGRKRRIYHRGHARSLRFQHEAVSRPQDITQRCYQNLLRTPKIRASEVTPRCFETLGGIISKTLNFDWVPS